MCYLQEIINNNRISILVNHEEVEEFGYVDEVHVPFVIWREYVALHLPRYIIIAIHTCYTKYTKYLVSSSDPQFIAYKFLIIAGHSYPVLCKRMITCNRSTTLIKLKRERESTYKLQQTSRWCTFPFTASTWKTKSAANLAIALESTIKFHIYSCPTVWSVYDPTCIILT